MSTKAPKQPKSTATPSAPSLPFATKQIPEERQIPASLIERYPFNRVPKPDAVAEVSESIKDVGQLQPVTCRSLGRPHADAPEQFQLIFGETRWLACQKIHADFPVRAYVLDIDDKETARIHTIENFQRRDLDEIEEAEAIKNMRDQGWTMEEIMTATGREKTHIYRRLTILKLSDEAKQAIRERNLSVNTAEVIAGLPPEQQGAALKAVVEPKYSDKALPEREAIAVLKRDYVDPAKKAKDWEERREEIEKEFPGAEWLDYAAAKEFRNENYQHIAFATSVPSCGYLTAAANERIKEPTVELPTWGELAAKHGITGTIAFEASYNEKVALFIYTAPVIAAERAADPESFFDDPDREADEDDGEDAAAVQAAEREREAALTTAIEGERLRIVEQVLSRKTIPKTASRNLVEAVLIAYIESSYEEWDHLEKVFPGVDRDAEYDVVRAHCLAEFKKLLKAKDADPFEVLGRVVVAHEIAKAEVRRYGDSGDNVATLALATGAFKRTEFPAMNQRFPEKPAEDEEQAPGAGAEGETQTEGESAAE